MLNDVTPCTFLTFTCNFMLDCSKNIFFNSGPGVDHVYTMNPMKEFVDNHDQHVETNFDIFVDKHGKNYETEHVKEKKKDTFR